MQATTYTVTGGVVWEVCFGTPTPWGVDCEEYVQLYEWAQTQAIVTPSAVPSADWVSPSNGTGPSQTFTFQFSSAGGAGNIHETWQVIHPTGSTTGSCVVGVYTQISTIVLWHDSGPGQDSSAPLGSGAVLENSQCRVLASGASQSASGDARTIVVPIEFKPAYTGTKNVYMWAKSAGGVYSPAVDKGNWTVPGYNVTADAASPNSGSGLTQTFSLTYSSTFGASDISQGWLWFSPSIGSGSASSCVILYSTSAHTLSLMDDAGTGWLPAVGVGTGPGPQNSQCAVDTVMAGASPSGNTWTVTVPVTFAASYNGLKRIYMSAISQSDAGNDILNIGHSRDIVDACF